MYQYILTTYQNFLLHLKVINILILTVYIRIICIPASHTKGTFLARFQFT